MTKKLIKKKLGGRPRKLPFEVRKVIAEEVLHGGITYRQAAQKFCVSQGAIALIVREFRTDGAVKDAAPPVFLKEDDLTVREQALERENKILKAEVGDLYLQIKMLKKAKAYERFLRSVSSSVITAESLEQLKEDAD